jgi:hypothetical protein
MRLIIAVMVCHIILFPEMVVADPGYLAGIKKDFTDRITADIDDFEVCEIIEKKSDKKEFLQRSFGKAYKPGKESVSYKEIFVRKVNENLRYHLGVVLIEFQSEKDAVSLFDALRGKDGTGFLGGTKILTQYKVLKQRNEVVLVYSETFSDQKVKQFMASLSAN